jgi:hypothetical protein
MVEQFWLTSRYIVPSEDGISEDQRMLGIPVVGITVDGKSLPLTSAALRQGWWGLEGKFRWTDGCAQIVLDRPARQISIEIDPRRQPTYRKDRMALPPDRQIVMALESLGDNCELGIVQRSLGAEPLGLLRFAGMWLPQLIQGLKDQFAGISDPAGLSITTLGTEFMVGVARYNYQYHSGVHIGQSNPEEIIAAQSEKLAFQRRAMLESMEDADKLFVFRQNEPITQSEIEVMVAELRQYGPCSVLWIVERDEAHSAGTVVLVADGLMKGFIERFAPREQANSPLLHAWLRVLRRAYEKWLGPPQQDGFLLRPKQEAARDQ